jgi:putative peptide zinc metalloprotease protein
MRRVLALVTTFTLWLAIPAEAGGPNQVVNASPTADGVAIHRSAVQVVSTGTSSVDSQNVAAALPTGCTGCEGVAVAFQALILTGRPSVIRPLNAAVAANTSCTSCKAFAFAYQLVVTADHGTHLSALGRAKVRDIRRRAAALVDAGLPFDQLDAQLSALRDEFRAAVISDLEHAGADPRDATPDLDVDEAPIGS